MISSSDQIIASKHLITLHYPTRYKTRVQLPVFAMLQNSGYMSRNVLGISDERLDGMQQNVKQIVVVYLSALRPPNTHEKCSGAPCAPANLTLPRILCWLEIWDTTHFTRLIIIVNLATVLPYYPRSTNLNPMTGSRGISRCEIWSCFIKCALLRRSRSWRTFRFSDSRLFECIRLFREGSSVIVSDNRSTGIYARVRREHSTIFECQIVRRARKSILSFSERTLFLQETAFCNLHRQISRIHRNAEYT
jgi:hypothetical protein